MSGAFAAILVAWFTFLPSFIFILAGGPLVESTHGNLNFTAPLTSLTAAVVGVIFNLALFFGYHILWPKGFEGSLDGISAAITAFASLALFRFKAYMMWVILGCALIGLLLQYML
jgi:chromate transporter